MKNKPMASDASLKIVDVPTSGPGAPPLSVTGVSTDDDRQTLREYVDIIVDARWVIAGSLFAALLLGGLFYVFAPPTYHADVVLQVEERRINIAAVENPASMSSSQSLADTETELLRSRMLVGAVVDALRLDIVAEPRVFPLLGGGIARRYDAETPAPPLLGLTSFAWGGESIQVAQLDVPRRWEDKRLALIARGARGYDLLDPGGALVARGQVGTPLRTGQVSAFVSSLTARPGTYFRLSRVRRDEVVEKLQKDLHISEKGKKTGLITVGLKGSDPDRIAAILNELARVYLRQNGERRSAEAESTLRFISGQMPQVKANLDKAEAALNEYRKQRGGGFDLSVETKDALDRSAIIERMLTELEMQRSDYRQKFTESHPALAGLTRKAEQLRAERAELERQLKGLPETELNAARLTRDARVAGELYVLLLNKSQELQLMKSAPVGNVRVVDAALIPEKPVSPQPLITLAVSALVGAALGIAIAFVRKALDQTVTDPELIERDTGLPVYATIPHSNAQLRGSRMSGDASGDSVLALSHPDELAVEALRSLRTSLQFALAEAPNNIVTIAGPSPDIGKSFVCVNLAHVLASVGVRVLLIDGDLRRGHLHRHFGRERAPGLSEVIRGTAAVKELVRTTSAANLHFLSTGTRPPNPSELLSSSTFGDVMTWASREYDLVLIDTPPLLAVTDAALIARASATNLLVLKPGEHPMREIAVTVKLLSRNGARPRAIILNDVAPKAAYARYEYR